MSDTAFLVLVLVVFLTFMGVLFWVQMTTPSRLDDTPSDGGGSHPQGH